MKKLLERLHCILFGHYGDIIDGKKGIWHCYICKEDYQLEKRDRV